MRILFFCILQLAIVQTVFAEVDIDKVFYCKKGYFTTVSESSEYWIVDSSKFGNGIKFYFSNTSKGNPTVSVVWKEKQEFFELSLGGEKLSNCVRYSALCNAESPLCDLNKYGN